MHFGRAGWIIVILNTLPTVSIRVDNKSGSFNRNWCSLSHKKKKQRPSRLSENLAWLLYKRVFSSSSSIILGGGSNLQVPHQVNMTDVGRVQLCISGWQQPFSQTVLTQRSLQTCSIKELKWIQSCCVTHLLWPRICVAKKVINNVSF